jgi:hypothetical protein
MRAFQKLDRQRTWRAILDGNVEKTLGSVVVNDAGQDRKVIVEGPWQDTLRCCVNEARAWLPQQQKHEKHALFIRLHLGALAVEFDGLRGNDHDCLLGFIESPYVLPERHELSL